MFNVYSQHRHTCLACQYKHTSVFCVGVLTSPNSQKITKTEKPKPDALLDRGLPVMGAQVQTDARPLVHPSMEHPEGSMASL